MKKIVCFFPGQGAQYEGMGRDLYEASETVRDMFVQASDAAGRDLKDLIFNGSEADLKNTDNTQVAVTLVSAAAHAVLSERGLLGSHGADGSPEADGNTAAEPVYAGFSLGELSAYYAAGIYDLQTLFTIANMRGRLMAKAADEAVASYGSLGMAAVIGKGFAEIEAVIRESGLEHVYPANDNGPGQVVVAGVEQGIQQLTELLKASGTRRIIPLKVSAPFHTPFLIPASEEFRDLIADFSFADPVHKVYTNVTGALVSSGAEAKENLVRQQISPVRWTTLMENIAGSKDISICLEAGPGKVLAGLWKNSGSDAVCRPAGTVNDIAAVQESINT
jgi:[acyl-carrier-protein] S-malonyltransferase